MQLRKAITSHENSGELPYLKESQKPLGGYLWQPSDQKQLVQSGEDLDNIIDVCGEGPSNTFDY